jgi:hypothetical protein
LAPPSLLLAQQIRSLNAAASAAMDRCRRPFVRASIACTGLSAAGRFSMSPDSAIPELDRVGLRRFGITTGALVAILFGLALPWLLGRAIPWWPWAIAAILLLLSILAPLALRQVYRGWMRFGLLMGRITTPLVLGIVFFLLLTPMALVFRWTGRDSMRRRIEATESYRTPSEQHARDRLERPF